MSETCGAGIRSNVINVGFLDCLNEEKVRSRFFFTELINSNGCQQAIAI